MEKGLNFRFVRSYVGTLRALEGSASYLFLQGDAEMKRTAALLLSVSFVASLVALSGACSSETETNPSPIGATTQLDGSTDGSGSTVGEDASFENDSGSLIAYDGGVNCAECNAPKNVCVQGTLTYYTTKCDTACEITLSSTRCGGGCGTSKKVGDICSGTNATGNFDSANEKGIRGWACDPDTPWMAGEVHIYFDAPPGVEGAIGIGGVMADKVSEQAVNDICGGENHRFVFTVADAIAAKIPPGTHNVWAYAISNASGESNVSITDAPKSITIPASLPDGG